MASSRQDSRYFDRSAAIAGLTRAFERAAEPFGPRSKAIAGTDLHGYQVDFAYFLDEIGRGTEASAKHSAVLANKLIARMNERVNGKEAASA